MAAIIMLALTSCGGSDPSKINEKIQAGESLDQTDYKEMIKYVDAAFMEIIEMTKNNGDKTFNEVLEEVDAKYPFCDNFMQSLYKNEDALDADNKNALESLLGNIIKTAQANNSSEAEPTDGVVAEEIEEILEAE